MAAEMPSPARGMLSRARLAWALVFGAGVALRLALFSGYGLGDDPNYFLAFRSIYLSRTYVPADPYQMRFGMWVPVVLCMEAFGATEAGFIGAITLCSIVNLALVYLLARQEWERPYALLAMALLAVFPLDVLCASLFANDMILATYCFTALWLYRAALADGGARSVRVAQAAAAGLFLFFGVVTKPWVGLVGPIFLFEGVKHWRRGWRRSLVAAGVLAALSGGYLAWQWARFGDPLYHISISRPLSSFMPYTRDALLDYPRMLLRRNEYGAYFAGFYPHALLLLALAFLWRAPGAAKWLVFLSLMLLGLAGFPSHKTQGHWVTIAPHIFRYLALISIPLCLALAAYVRELYLWRRAAGVALTAALLMTAIADSVTVTGPSRDAFGDERAAVAVLRTFPDEPVSSDYHLLARFEFFAGRSNPRIPIKSETPLARAAEFARVTEGVVVTGGGRLPWYGCSPCIADVDGFAVPPSWFLVKTFEGRPLTPYRHEPLRVWRVSQAALEAKELLERESDGGARRELLADLFARARYATAAEVGRQLLETGPDDPAVAHLTGMACAHTGRVGCATRYLERALSSGLAEPEARDTIVQLALLCSRQNDFAGARRWASEFRRRFPGVPQDPQLAEIESGLSEGVASYNLGKLPDARRIFAAMLSRPDEDPDRRRRALYYLALTLFRMGRLRDAVERAGAYRAQYGEDSSWVELRYREGEALGPTDPRRAREVFADVVEHHAGTYWANEARRQLAAGAGAGGS